MAIGKGLRCYRRQAVYFAYDVKFDEILARVSMTPSFSIIAQCVI